MELTRAQGAVVSDTHRFRVLVCGRKFGKTTLSAEEIAACAFCKDGQRVMYIAPTLDDARRLMWDRIKSKFRDSAEKANDTRLELIVPTQDGGKSTIFLGSWEKVNNYRGDEFNLIVFDECQDYRNFYKGWEEAMRPTLTPRMGQAMFEGTPKGFNHLYDLFGYQVDDPSWKSFHYTTYDNPHIPVEEIEEAKRRLTPDRFAQEYMADFRKTEGLVYKEFNRDKHVYSQIPQDIRIIERIAGIDFGFSNPAAVMDIWIDSTDCWWVEGEFYKTGQTDAMVAEFVAATNFMMVYPDPEAPGAIAELRKRGVNVREVVKGKDSIKHGIDHVRERLKANKLKIKSTNVNTILEFETYAYPDKKDFRNEDENPIKENDHAMDGLRYPVMMRATRNAQAHTHIPSNMQPRNNITPFQTMQGLPVELQDNRPKLAHTHIPRL